MFKNLGSATIIGMALVCSIFVYQAAAQSYEDEPVPGGMCGCLSCNCYMVDAEVAAVEEGQSLATNYSTDPHTLTASVADLESIHDREETRISNLTLPESKRTPLPEVKTGSANPANNSSKSSYSSAAASTASLSGGSSKPANSNKIKTTNANTTPTGASSASYPYTSTKPETTLPYVNSSSYSPTLTPRSTSIISPSADDTFHKFQGMGDNVKTLIPVRPANSASDVYSGIKTVKDLNNGKPVPAYKKPGTN